MNLFTDNGGDTVEICATSDGVVVIVAESADDEDLSMTFEYTPATAARIGQALIAAAAAAGADPLAQHVDAIAAAAHLGVMGNAGILGILADRETVTGQIQSLTGEDVVDLYERFVGPAVDAVEYHLSVQQ